MRNHNTRKGLLNQALAELRMKMVIDSLKKFYGNKTKAAAYLGVERTALTEMLKTHGRLDLISPRCMSKERAKELAMEKMAGRGRFALPTSSDH